MEHSQHAIFQANDIKNVTLMDNQSTVSLFCNPELVNNNREVDEELILTTNAG